MSVVRVRIGKRLEAPKSRAMVQAVENLTLVVHSAKPPKYNPRELRGFPEFR